MIQMIWLANETTAVNHELNLSLTFGFEVQTSASKFTFQSKNKDLKATCRIGVEENMFFSNMTITKQRPRTLRLKLFNLLSWVWNEEQLYFITAARGLPELVTTLEKLNCFHSEHRRGYQTKLLTDHSNGGRLTVELRFAKMTGDRH